MQEEILGLLARYPEPVRELALGVLDVLRGWLPGSSESVDLSAGLVGFSYGPGYKGTVATLLLSKGGVKIGLAYSAQLDDPHGLLAGAGKVHKHVAVKTLADLERVGVRELVEATRELCLARLQTR